VTDSAGEAELARLRAALQAAQDRAHRADEAHARVLAAVAHEIRNPLHAMLSLLGLLRESELDPQRRGWVETARDSGLGLLALLDDLLELGRAEAGELALVEAPFQPAELVGGVVDLLRARAVAKGLRFESDVALDDAPWLAGDARRLRQILFNLLGNAIKSTEEGSVRLRVAAGPADEERVALTVDIADSGVGFDKNRPLFDAVPHGPQEGRGSSGELGLSIARRLVELMQGTIEVESEPGTGTRFHVQIVLPRAAAQAAETAKPAAPAAAARRAHVLLVEDSPTNRAVALAMLRTAPLAVDAVENGAQALERLRHAQYDLVLMDVAMPVLDGLDTTRAIRALNGPISRVPVIAMTANALSADEARCREAGMNDYLTKPIERANLFAMLTRWLGPLGTPRKVIDEPTVARLLHEVEPGSLARLLGVFVREAANRAARIDQAIMQLDQPKSLAQIEHESHALKGGAETFGASAVATCAAAIEAAARARDLDALRRAATGLAALVSEAEESFRQRRYLS
jgi:CheY-like chemotaxis protein/nitrogen-specific signal transduction histidine kinase/HPt (histidine-containing phosphotransfer) domain-containing protein